MLTAGTYGNVLRFLPPLVIRRHLLNEGLDVLEHASTPWHPEPTERFRIMPTPIESEKTS